MAIEINISAKMLARRWAKITFGSSERERMYEKLAALIGNGVKLSNAIDALYEQAAKRGATDTETIVLADLRLGIARGEGLSKSLADWASPVECMLIASGESSGNLGSALNLSASSLRGAKEMRNAIIEALSYPALLMIAVIGVVYYIGIGFIPEMAQLADPTTFTGAAASLYMVSEFTQSIWFLVVLAIMVCMLVVIAASMPKTFGDDRFRVYLDRFPPWSLYRLAVGSSFLVSLAAMLRGGIMLNTSILQIKSFASPYLALRLQAILVGINKGEGLGGAMYSAKYEFPDRTIVDDLVTYSSLPNFAEVLDKFGQLWMIKGVEAVKKQAQVMKGFASLMMAVVIGWLVFGVMQVQQQIAAAISLN